MKEEIKFRLGDRVYAPFHGYGVVTAIHEDACVYPIEVTWDDSGLKNMEDASTFTADGLLSKYYANTDTILTVVKGSHKRNRRKEMSASKFKVGDRVYNPSHGYGVVTEIKDDEQEYPIVVTWEEKQHGCISIFTPEGFAVKGLNSEDDDLTLVEKASLKGEKEMEEDSKFQVGDRVYAPFHKYGTIVEIVDTDASYPITVRWDESRYKIGIELSTFTEDGYLFFSDKTENTKITKVKKDESTIERMEDALSKKVEDAVNPAHYKVEGLPEAYDIMTHLMNREQLEGFLWGNIIKYAYRYGRKGDEAETAGKIKWYAQKLKELGECESE
jgi:heat shock protein HspQ